MVKLHQNAGFNVADLAARNTSGEALINVQKPKTSSAAESVMGQMFGPNPTLRQADGLRDLEPVNSAEVPAWVQRDDP